MPHLHNDSVDRLFQTILNLSSIEECYAYFEDLCTIKEVLDMAQRLDTAALLAKGTSYQQICQQVGVSTATVGRVSKCLNYGTGGYRTALDRLEEEEV